MKLSSTFLSRYSTDLLENFKTEAIIYFHWPFCKNICTFCSFNKYKKSESNFGKNVDKRMENLLIKETQTILGFTGIKKINSIYFGGGTPSLAPTTTISRIINCVKQLTNVGEQAEITIECNSSSVSMTHKLEDYRKFGINRVSVGLQSLHDRTLEILGRDHSANDSVMLLKNAIDIFGSDAVSVDLLFRKPGDTIQSWKEELFQILSYKPHHISLYELTPERGTPLFRQLQSGEVVLPNENDTASMYILALELLKENGFERYEISNFAKVGSCAQSSHNMSYWNGTQYIGIGPGAHSRFFPLGTSLRESRVQTLDPKSWQDLVEINGHATRLCKQQSQVDVLSELLATSLRTTDGIQQHRWLIFQPKYSLADVFELAPAIKMFCLSGHLQWNTDGSLRATEKGLNVVDSILPNILTVLNEFYDKNKLEICRYLKLFIHATLSSMNHQ